MRWPPGRRSFASTPTNCCLPRASSCPRFQRLDVPATNCDPTGLKGLETDMKYGMNMLLWTTEVEPSHDPLLARLKEWGYDGVEIPIFQMEQARYARLGMTLDS